MIRSMGLSLASYVYSILFGPLPGGDELVGDL